MLKRTTNSEPLNWLIHHIQVVSIEKQKPFIQGKLLDIGCGQKPYREIIGSSCIEYIGLENINSLHNLSHVDVIGDALKLPFHDKSFNTVVSFQVMEHIPEPQQFLDEVYRVLVPGGHAILTTPFLWGEHEIPYDFFRYTRYGLKYLVTKSGFEIVTIEPQSKFWSMIVLRFNYYLARFFKGPLRFIPYPIYLIDQIVAYLLDLMPHNYTIDTVGFTTVIKKPTATMDH